MSIIVLGHGGRLANHLECLNVNLYILNTSVRIPNFWLIPQLIRQIRLVKPDVVHCQAAEANFHGLIAARLAGVPVRIAEEVGLPNHHSYWKIIFKVVYFFSTEVIAISQAVKNTIVGYKEVPAHKVRVIYNPIDTDTLDAAIARSAQISEASSENRKNCVFITTCRLVPVKNLDRLIKAFANFLNLSPGRTASLWIVGDGEERPKLEGLSESLNLQGHITFWGYQSNVAIFLAKSDIFVLPSLSEGSSLSLAEAMYMGLPSIVTNRGGAAEILGTSESGILVDPMDAKKIASAMQELATLSTNERREMGNRARKEAERFKVSNYMAELMKAYTGKK